jgi:septal ring factor EnvC (AmiA/AmiB activator)
LIDHLLRSLGVVERRRKMTQLSVPDRASLTGLEQEISAIEQRVADAVQRSASLNNELDVCIKKVVALEKALEASGGRLLEHRKKMEAEYRELKDKQAQIAVIENVRCQIM